MKMTLLAADTTDWSFITSGFEQFSKDILDGVKTVVQTASPVVLSIIGITTVASVLFAWAAKTGKFAKH